jgi:hypothetical protein
LDELKSRSKSYVLLVDGEPMRRTGAFTVPYADAYAGGVPARGRPGATNAQGAVVSRIRLKEDEEPIDLGTTKTSPINVFRDGAVQAVFPGLPPGQDTYYFIVRADADAPFASVVDAVHVAQARGRFVAFAVAPPSRATVGLKEWDCAFPPEADTAGIDEAAVLLRAQVDASGRAIAVTVVQDPGHGFGEAARVCAMLAAYEPARDDRGQPMEAMTNVFRVHFQRPPPDDEKR